MTEAECNDDYVQTNADAARMLQVSDSGTWHDGMPLAWSNPSTGSFDNFGDAMRLLYIMSSADQWVTPMFVMMGATGPGQAPARNDFSPAAIFAIAWMFLGYIFAINL